MGTVSVPVFSIDVETHSPVNLNTDGSDAYSRHPITRCLMMAYHLIGAPNRPDLWCEGDPVPEILSNHARRGGKFSGWNVLNFDRLVYERKLVTGHNFPPISDDAWIDSMHRAAHANLPRSLDGCASAVGIKYEVDLKDKHRLLRITNSDRTQIPTTIRDVLQAKPIYKAERENRSSVSDPPRALSHYVTPLGVSIAPLLFDDITWLASRCVQDVELEEALLLRLPEWPTFIPWLNMPAIDRRINDRGILMDVPLVQGLVRAATIETARLDVDMAKITDGFVARTSNVESLKHWLVEQGVELPPNRELLKTASSKADARRLLRIDGADEGDATADLDAEDADTTGAKKSPWMLRKNDIADLLARKDIPENCRLALAMRAEAAKASAKKLRTMLLRASPDGRLRRTMNLGGAQQTMRWASTGVNLYNTVRDVFANADEVADTNGLNAKRDKEAVKRLSLISLDSAIRTGHTGDPEFMRAMYETPRKDAQGRIQLAGVLVWISRMIRRTLAVPVGRMMLNGDFAQIEARITVWLAQQMDVVTAFANREDIYTLCAAGIYGVPPELVTKQMRQAGKVAILACGFGGGPNALIAMGYNYGLLMTRLEAVPIVQGYRKANSFVQNYWYATDDAAANAVRYPGMEFPVAPCGIVSYIMIENCLCCRLPSGRLLRYWQPRLHQEYWLNEDGSQGKPKDRLSLSGIAIKGRSVFRRSLYHTILVENQVQAIAADMLAHCLENADNMDIPVILHVYDSLAAEVGEDRVEAELPRFEEAMLNMPPWTFGLPTAIDADYGARFG